MWALRKFYGGQGGALPPTDPRIMEMTMTQIDLEFHHIMLDRQESGDNVYTDDGYDDYEKDTDEVDSQLSDMPVYGREAADPHAGQAETTNDTEWEDVEIDDLD